MKKLIMTIAVAAAAFSVSQAQAVTISFGGQTATDGSGLTSQRVSATNIVDPATGYFIETFDQATQNPAFPGPITTSYPNQNPDGGSTGAPHIGIAQGSGCSINSTAGGVAINVTQGSFAVQSGNNSSGANPAGDNTCYGFGPGPAPRADGTNATVIVDFSALLGAGVNITYLGLYYGSIDTYNNLIFYTGTAGNYTQIGEETGADVLAAAAGTSGNQTAPGSNVYVNMDFLASEGFTAIGFQTTGIAFEVDNIVVGVSNRADIPEPASIALLGLGLAGLAAARKRKQA